MKTPHRQAQGGFTLLEVMMAAVVLVLGIATSITTLQHGMRTVDTARNLTLAGQIMQSEIENLRLKNWAQISALPASDTVDVAATISAGVSSSSALNATLNNLANRFTLTRTVADAKTDMKVIVLTATWNGVDGRSHTTTYRTHYGRNGLNDYYYTSH